MRLSYIAAVAIATFVSTAAASPFAPVLEKRAASCKNDNDCPGVTCCNLSTLKCVSDPHGTICDIPPKKTTSTKKSTTTKKSSTTTKKPSTTTKKSSTTTKKSSTTTKKSSTTTKKTTTTTKKTTTTTRKSTTTTHAATATATPSYGPMNPAPMNPKPTCRSYTENFTNTVVEEASDWAPTSTDVDMVNISGSKSAYQIEEGILKLRMMQPKFNANGKPKAAAIAATLDMAFEMQYGVIEVRMKTSPVNGVCTSINTMSENGDEIDIEMAPHYFNTQPPSIQEYNYFWHRQGSGPPGVTHGGYVNLGYNSSADYHVYRAEWNPDSIIWKTDGVVVHVQNKNETFDGTNYIFPTEPSRIELGIWDAGFANSGWSGGPIPWHDYKEVNAWFDYVKIECNPTYNHVIPARTTTTSKAVALNVNLEAQPARDVNKTIHGGIKIGRHASPGVPPKDTKLILTKVADGGYNHASPGSATSKSIEKIN